MRQDDEVSIYAGTGPVGEEPIPTSPYHVVTVRKIGQWGGSITFHYYLDDEGEVATVSHDIPASKGPLWP